MLTWAISILSLQLKPIFYFFVEYPEALMNVCLEAVFSSFGQLFSYYLILNFKQHIMPLVMTTRKSLSVVLSIIVYGHRL